MHWLRFNGNFNQALRKPTSHRLTADSPGNGRLAGLA
jgi:hypothetical protein